MIVKTFFSILVIATAFGSGAMLYLGSQPDYDVTFSREVQSKTPHDLVVKSLSDIKYWPKWFHHLKTTVPASGAPKKGQIIELLMEPPGKEWKRYTLRIHVLEYVPGERFKAFLVSDSSFKISKLFEKVEWTFEIKPNSVVGTLSARTRHWKARVFSSFAGRVLMNQIYYLNLEKLAGFKQPFDPDQVEPVVPPSPY